MTRRGGTRLREGRPVWLNRGSRPGAAIYPRLRSRRQTEIAIVGGGITGALVATTFASAGVHVCVLEGKRVGLGSTAASTALLLQEPDNGLVDLGRRYGPAASVRIWQLSREAARGLIATLQHYQVRCDLVERDSVYYTSSHDKVARLRTEHRRRAKAGFAAEWLPAAALEQFGIPARGGIRSGGNAQCDPYAAGTGLMAAAAAMGAEIFERSTVTRIEQTRRGVLVHTGEGSIKAARVVIATGYATQWFRPLVGHFRMQTSYVLATRPLQARERDALGVPDLMLWDTETPYHYARWTADHRLLLGGADRLAQRGSKSDGEFARAAAQLRAHYREMWPGLERVAIDHAWTGLFARTPDGLPFIGPHRRYPRHLFALGYGGNGMTFGALAARVLLEQWRGTASRDHELFAFGRLR